MFARFAGNDTTSGVLDIPAGAVVHARLGPPTVIRRGGASRRLRSVAAGRPTSASAPVRTSAWACTSRAEMTTAITAPSIDSRIPPDPDAETLRIIGMYERGATEVPVVWG
jgi:hypothetical protein